MLEELIARWWRIAAGVLMCAVLFGAADLWSNYAAADNAASPSSGWTAPTATTLKKVLDNPAPASNQEYYQNNVDCDLITYRLVSDQTMQRGCFVPTAFGMMQLGGNLVIFNGSDEAVPVSTVYGALTPIPGSVMVGDINGTGLHGATLDFYTYFPNNLHDIRDAAERLVSKQMIGNPAFRFSDSSGQPIDVNPQSMAYSGGGSWLVVESPLRSFMRVNTTTFQIMPFAPSFTTNGLDYAPHNSQVTISDDGRYVAVVSNEYAKFTVYDLASCSGTVTSSLQPLGCASHDYWPYASSHIGGLAAITHLQFINNGLLSFDAGYKDTATAPLQRATYELAPQDHIDSLIDYLALGDSYSSGEGAFDYLNGTDTGSNGCHLSSRSYPLLLQHDLFNSAAAHSVACSGAKAWDIHNGDMNYTGQVNDYIKRQDRPDEFVKQVLGSFMPGYLAQDEFVKQYQPRIVTVGVGGNDIGFADIITACATPFTVHITCYGAYEDRLELVNTINSQFGKLASLYKQLAAASPSGTIYAVGYPQIAAAGGSCALNVHMDIRELAFSQVVIDYLNSVIERAADSAGVRYVDISHALEGHRLCETKSYNVAVNGLTAGNDGGALGINFIGKESYHPNALGHELIEQAILERTHSFADADKLTANPDAAPPTAVDASPEFLSGPHSGRPIRKVIPDDTMTVGLLIRGNPTTVRADSSAGLKPSSTYSVTLGSGGSNLGSFTSSTTGEAIAPITVPADAPPGYQPIDISGQNANGDPIDITKIIYVGASGDDYDDDGTPNSSDACPAGEASGQDVDQDGIDDACDGYIGAPPPATPPPASGGGTTDIPPATGSNDDQGNSGTGAPAGQPPGPTPAVTSRPVTAATTEGQLSVQPVILPAGSIRVTKATTSPATAKPTTAASGTSAVLGAQTRQPVQPPGRIVPRLPAYFADKAGSVVVANRTNPLVWLATGGAVLLLLFIILWRRRRRSRY